MNSLSWQTASKVNAHARSCTINGLRENQQYFFRVIAINQAGASEPLESGLPSFRAPSAYREARMYHLSSPFITHRLLTFLYPLQNHPQLLEVPLWWLISRSTPWPLPGSLHPTMEDLPSQIISSRCVTPLHLDGLAWIVSDRTSTPTLSPIWQMESSTTSELLLKTDVVAANPLRAGGQWRPSLLTVRGLPSSTEFRANLWLLMFLIFLHQLPLTLREACASLESLRTASALSGAPQWMTEACPSQATSLKSVTLTAACGPMRPLLGPTQHPTWCLVCWNTSPITWEWLLKTRKEEETTWSWLKPFNPWSQEVSPIPESSSPVFKLWPNVTSPLCLQACQLPLRTYLLTTWAMTL